MFRTDPAAISLDRIEGGEFQSCCDEWVQRVSRMGIVLATGEHDHLARDSREVASPLRSEGIPAHYEIWSGAFGRVGPWWIESLRRFVA